MTVRNSRRQFRERSEPVNLGERSEPAALFPLSFFKQLTMAKAEAQPRGIVGGIAIALWNYCLL